MPGLVIVNELLSPHIILAPILNIICAFNIVEYHMAQIIYMEFNFTVLWLVAEPYN